MRSRMNGLENLTDTQVEKLYGQAKLQLIIAFERVVHLEKTVKVYEEELKKRGKI